MSQELPTLSSSKNSDWRNSVHPEDMLSALNSMYSYEDHSSRAAIYASAGDSTPMNIDLMVQGVQLAYNEHLQVLPVVGDYISAIALGKAPMQATVSAILVDTPVNYGKQYLIDAYKNKLRLTAVARTGVIPAFRYLNTLIHGPFIDLKVVEDSNSQDTAIVSLTIFVMSLEWYKVGPSGNTTLLLDYVHGTESTSDTKLESNSGQLLSDTEVKYIPNSQSNIA